LLDDGAEIALLLDASIFPVAPIDPLIRHIEKHGYFLARAGFTVGEWATDTALDAMGVSREEALRIPDIASGCVGLDLRREEFRNLLKIWCSLWYYFPGFHSNVHATDKSYSYRNEGFVSNDPRVRGHRHDQTMLSMLAHARGMHELVSMPHLLNYTKPEADTVLVVQGISK